MSVKITLSQMARSKSITKDLKIFKFSSKSMKNMAVNPHVQTMLGDG